MDVRAAPVAVLQGLPRLPWLWAGAGAVVLLTAMVIGVDDDIASRWGPRVVDFLRVLAPHVKQAEQQAA